MKDISNMKNYREKYKRYYGIQFGKEYAIHHIDLNHNNNSISNLLLLPSKLHSKYHYQKSIVETMKIPTIIGGCMANSHNYYIGCIEEFFETLRECNKWCDYKLYLDGYIPNIHMISLGE